MRERSDVVLAILVSVVFAGADVAAQASSLSARDSVYECVGANQRGDTTGTHACITRTRNEAERHRSAGDMKTAAEYFMWLGTFYAQLGQPDSALVAFRAGVSVGRRQSDSALATVFERKREDITLMGIAQAYRSMGQPDSVLWYYQILLTRHRQQRDLESEARTLSMMSVVQEALGHMDSALVLVHAARRVARDVQNRSTEALILSRVGTLFEVLGGTDSALAYHDSALTAARAGGDRLAESIALGNRANLFYRIGRLDSALASQRATMPAVLASNNAEAIGTLFDGLGTVLGDLGWRDSAFYYFAEALRLHRAARNRPKIVSSLASLGRLYVRVGRPDSALVILREALRLTRDTKDVRLEAELLNNLGGVYARFGRPDSALAYRESALRMYRDQGNRDGEAAALDNIGVTYLELGRLDSALWHARASLAVSRQIRSLRGEASALNNIALVHESVGALDSALTNHQAALALERDVGNKPNESASLGNIGTLYERLGRLDSAVTYSRAALALRRAVGDREGEWIALNSLGSHYRELARTDPGKLDSSLSYYRAALTGFHAAGHREGEVASLGNLASVYLRGPTGTRDPARAAKLLDTAVALAARVRRRAGGDANAISFAEGQHALYRAWAAAWLMQLSLGADTGAVVRAALGAVERGRARSLVDLVGRRDRAAESVPALAGGRADTVAGADIAAEATRIIEPLRRQHVAVLYYLTTTDTMRTAERATSVDTLTAWLLAPNGTLRLLPVRALDGDSLARLVALVREELGVETAGRIARGQTGARDVESLRGLGIESRRRSGSALEALSALVLPRELATVVPPGSELVVVPNGALGLVPFAALPVPGDTLPLGLRNALRYAPALSVLSALDAASRNKGSRVTRSSPVLVVGDPAMPDVSDAFGRTAHLTALPGARAEGAWVAARLGGVVWSGPEATETMVREQLPAAHVVHLATHGFAYSSEARVRQSWIALAPDGRHDGLLTMAELLDDPALQLSAELVVLSACQTGLGQVQQAEGTIGLQRALLARGARSVLVSLWNVDDGATRLLMQRFYTNWLGLDGMPVAPTKAEALRRAQTDVRRTRGYAHPRYWSAFQLVGAR